MAPRRHKPAIAVTAPPADDGLDEDAYGIDDPSGDAGKALDQDDGAVNDYDAGAAGSEDDDEAGEEAKEATEDEYDEDGEDGDDEAGDEYDDADAEYEADAEYAEDDDGEAEDDADAEDDDGEAEDDADAEYDEDADDEYDEDADDGIEYHTDDEYDDSSGANDSGTRNGSNGKAFTPPTALAAIRNAFRSPAQRAQPATGTAEDEQRVNFVNSRERNIGYFLGVIMVALAVVTYVRYAHYVDATNLKLQKEYRRDAPWISLITLALGLVILLATVSKRRAAVAFSVLLAGVANFGVDPIVGFLYLGTGLWLVFRSMKRSPRARTAGAGARAGGVGTGARGGSRATSAATGRAGAGSSRAGGAGAGAGVGAGSASIRGSQTTSSSSRPGRTIGRNGRVSNAPVSGRYTPPKPTRHVPPAVQPEPESSNRLSSWLKK